MLLGCPLWQLHLKHVINQSTSPCLALEAAYSVSSMCFALQVIVVASPANTNALALKMHARNIPEANITCLTRLDHNRALAHIAEHVGVSVKDVHNVIIWGNHASTQYPDVNHATVRGQPVRAVVQDDAFLDNDFVTTIQNRGIAIMRLRGLSAALSAATAICDHMYSWIQGTQRHEWVSMGVVSDGSYGIEPGLVYSYPVVCKGGKWHIVQDLPIDAASWSKMQLSAEELMDERQLAQQVLSEEQEDEKKQQQQQPQQEQPGASS
eukprot:jgi/Chrzof1/2717/Cz11g26110.t1